MEFSNINIDDINKIHSEMPAPNPSAPVGSNKNPIRIIQQGSHYINTQNISDARLQQIIQVLNNEALVSGVLDTDTRVNTSEPASKVRAIYNRFTNKRIVFRVTRAKKRNQTETPKTREFNNVRSGKKCLLVDSVYHETETVGSCAKRRCRHRRNRGSSDDDPDFEPDLPEEELLPFPIMRKKTDSGRISKPPKHLIRNYKHLHLKDLKEAESSALETDDDIDSDGGYSDYINAKFSDEANSDQAQKSKVHCCQTCDKSFNSRAGLARHNSLKHNPKGGNQRGPWSNPYQAEIRRRRKLKEALEGATVEDLIEVVAPHLAKVMSVWEYILLRSEDSNTSLPIVSIIITEYLSLVKRVQLFLSDQLDLISTEEEKLVVPEDEGDLISGRPAPASIKRQRQRILISGPSDAYYETPVILDTVSSPTEPVFLLNSISDTSIPIRGSSQSKEENCFTPDTEIVPNSHTSNLQVSIAQSWNIDVSKPVDESKITSPSSNSFSLNPLPTSSISTATSHFFSKISSCLQNSPKISVNNGPRTPLTSLNFQENFSDASCPSKNAFSSLSDLQSWPETGAPGDNIEDNQIIRVNTTQLENALSLPPGAYKVRPSLCVDYMPRRYRAILSTKIINVTHDKQSYNLTNNQNDDNCAGNQSTAGITSSENFPPQPLDHCSSTFFSTAWTDNTFRMSGEGLGYPIPDEWISTGAFLPLIRDTGESSDLVIEAVSGRIFHRPTGQLVTLSEESTISPSNEMRWLSSDVILEQSETTSDQFRISESDYGAPVDISSVLPGVSVSEISRGISLVTKPNGISFHVEHGEEGITLDTLQAILSINDE